MLQPKPIVSLRSRTRRQPTHAYSAQNRVLLVDCPQEIVCQNSRQISSGFCVPWILIHIFSGYGYYCSRFRSRQGWPSSALERFMQRQFAPVLDAMLGRRWARSDKDFCPKMAGVPPAQLGTQDTTLLHSTSQFSQSRSLSRFQQSKPCGNLK
ncbi:hypothetical protein VTO42DRAFT_8506 [Malbranchea cinnamomea]